MRNLSFVVVSLALVLRYVSATAADERPQLTGVSTVRVANYGTPSTVIHDRERANAIVGEFRQLRGKAWRRADTKLSCYATLVLLNGSRPVTLFRISPDIIVERAQGKGQSSYSLDVAQSDMPRTSALLAGIPPAKDCN